MAIPKAEPGQWVLGEFEVDVCTYALVPPYWVILNRDYPDPYEARNTDPKGWIVTLDGTVRIPDDLEFRGFLRYAPAIGESCVIPVDPPIPGYIQRSWILEVVDVGQGDPPPPGGPPPICE